MSALVARDVWAAPPGAPDPAVRGFSLEVARGEWLALHGPNGGGKTTLALVLAGLWPARRGAVTFEGRPLSPGEPESRAAVAALLQDPAVQLLESTVRDELSLTARDLGQEPVRVRGEVERIAAALGLDGELPLDPRTLSAGRQQLLLIGAALVAGPRLLVADEAGAHLDRGARGRVLALLRAEAARGLSIVWVTQEPAEIEAADRSLRIGDPEALPAAPAHAPAEGSGAPLLVLEVAPARAETGPRVAVSEPLRIEVVRSGITALEGPNGAGKSVLLAAAAGAHVPPQVAVRWLDGVRGAPLLVGQYPEREIFQERVLDEMTWAAIQRGAGREAARAAARSVLEALGLGAAFGERRVWAISGGEKRLVQVGGALIAPASVLLLDEPTAGLDPSRKEALGDLLVQRSRDNPAMVASQDSAWLIRIGARRLRLGG